MNDEGGICEKEHETKFTTWISVEQIEVTETIHDCKLNVTELPDTETGAILNTTELNGVIGTVSVKEEPEESYDRQDSALDHLGESVSILVSDGTGLSDQPLGNVVLKVEPWDVKSEDTLPYEDGESMESLIESLGDEHIGEEDPACSAAAENVTQLSTEHHFQNQAYFVGGTFKDEVEICTGPDDSEVTNDGNNQFVCPKIISVKGNAHHDMDEFSNNIMRVELDHNYTNVCIIDKVLGKMYCCSYCDSKFSSKINFRRHEIHHTGMQPHDCRYCDASFLEKDSLDCHERTHSKTEISRSTSGSERRETITVPEKLYNCCYCTAKFRKKSHLRKHAKTHTGENRYQCSVCDSKFGRISSLRAHVKTHSSSGSYIPVLENIYSCRFCTAKFRRKFLLRKHMKNHAGESTHLCCFCDSKFSRISSLRAHLKTHSGTLPYSCSYCGAKFPKKADLDHHIGTGTETTSYKCSFCDAKFTLKCTFENHLKSHNLDNSCSEASSSEKLKRVHVRSISSEKLKRVHARSISSEKLKRVHARSSSSEKLKRVHAKSSSSEKLKSVHARSSSSEKLKRVHAKSSSSEKLKRGHDRSTLTTGSTAKSKPTIKVNRIKNNINRKRTYPCSYCGSKFSLKSHLHKHKQIHIKKPRYNCTQCRAKFRLKCNFDNHVRIHSKKQFYSCKQCKAKFSVKNNLSKHERIHTRKIKDSFSQSKSSIKSSSVKTVDRRKAVFRKQLYRPVQKVARYNPKGSFQNSKINNGFVSSKLKIIRQKNRLQKKDNFLNTVKCYKCARCNFVFDRLDKLKRHERFHARELHVCSHCSSEFKQKSILDRHERAHARERLFICSQCGVRFKEERDLDKHQISHITNKNLYMCSECKLEFRDEKSLKEHKHMHRVRVDITRGNFNASKFMKVHLHNTPVKDNQKNCESTVSEITRHCEEFCKQNDGSIQVQENENGLEPVVRAEKKLKTRRKTRSTAKKSDPVNDGVIHRDPHSGTDCNAKFNVEMEVHRHKETHVKEGPHQCSYCDAKFNLKWALKIHEITHSVEQPYICVICHARFGQTDELRRHEQTHIEEASKDKIDVEELAKEIYPTFDVLNDPPKIPTATSKSLNDPPKIPPATSKSLNDPPKIPPATSKSLNDPPKIPPATSKSHEQSPRREPLDVPSESVSTEACPQNSPQIIDFSQNADIFNSSEIADDMSSGSYQFENHTSQELPYSKDAEKHTTFDGRDGDESLNTQNGIADTSPQDKSAPSSNVPVSKPDQCKKPFACSQCGARFTRKGNLKIHQQIHTGIKPFRCSLCSARFVRKHQLERHRLSHTREKRRRMLQMLRKKHSSNLVKNKNPLELGRPDLSSTSDVDKKVAVKRPYGCSYCPARFTQRPNLKRHEQIHTGERPFGCDKCGAKFMQKHHLSNHVLTHTGEKPHPCTICHARFKQKNDLTRHIRIHTNDRPYSCSFCNDTFSLRSQWEAHERTHSGFMSYKCSHCNATYNTKTGLSRHENIHSLGIDSDAQQFPKLHPGSNAVGQSKTSLTSDVGLSANDECIDLVKIELPPSDSNIPNPTLSDASDGVREGHARCARYPFDSIREFASPTDLHNSDPCKLPAVTEDQCGISPNPDYRNLLKKYNILPSVVVLTPTLCYSENAPEILNRTFNKSTKSTKPNRRDFRKPLQNSRKVISSTDTPQSNDPPLDFHSIGENYSDSSNQLDSCSNIMSAEQSKIKNDLDSTEGTPSVSKVLLGLPGKHPGRNKETKYKCSCCEATFPLKKALIRHERTHPAIKIKLAQDRPFSCSYCGVRFSQKGNMKTHEKIHIGEKKFECKTCGAKFIHKYHLTRHEFRHTGVKPHCCHDCDTRFAQKSDLIRHIRIHTNERPYSCSFCPATFILSGNWRAHERTHTGVRPHKCTYCDSRFTQKVGLRQHLVLHTGERPYTCSQCNAGFKRKGHLTYHMQIHNEKEHACSKCDAKFTLIGKLRRHEKIHDENGSLQGRTN